MGLNSMDDVLARNEWCVSLFKVQEHPELEAGYGRDLANRERAPRSGREATDLCTSTVEALVLISIKYTEDMVVSPTLFGAVFSIFHDRDRRQATLISWDYDFGCQQLELQAYRVKVRLFRLAFANDERDRARLAISRAPSKLVAPTDLRYGASRQDLAAQLTYGWHGAVPSFEVAALNCLAFAWFVVQEWV